jgi:uncharacterized membrane protein YesL
VSESSPSPPTQLRSRPRLVDALRLFIKALGLTYENLGMSLVLSIVWFFAVATAAAFVNVAPIIVPLAIVLVSPIHAATAAWANLVVHRDDAGFKAVVRAYRTFFARSLLLGAMHAIAAFVCTVDVYIAFTSQSSMLKIFAGIWVYGGLFVGAVFMYAYPVMVEQNTTAWKAVRRSALLILDNLGFTAVAGLVAALLLAAGTVPTVLMLGGVQAAGTFSIIGVMVYAGLSSVYRNLAAVRLLQRYDAARVSERERLQDDLEEERMARLERNRITWHGHSCFSLVMEGGCRVVMDPFDAAVGYPLPEVAADVVTISHDHFDHNNAAVVKGSPKVLKGLTDLVIGGVRFRSVESSHDAPGESKRGMNYIFLVETDDFRICHLGDLGQPLNERQLTALGNVDVLLIPVGGTYTIDAATAVDVVAAVRPRAVIPIHYKTDATGFDIAGKDAFLSHFSDVRHIGETSWSVRRSDLAKPEAEGVGDIPVVVLNYN